MHFKPAQFHPGKRVDGSVRHGDLRIHGGAGLGQNDAFQKRRAGGHEICHHQQNNQYPNDSAQPAEPAAAFAWGRSSRRISHIFSFSFPKDARLDWECFSQASASCLCLNLNGGKCISNLSEAKRPGANQVEDAAPHSDFGVRISPSPPLAFALNSIALGSVLFCICAFRANPAIVRVR